MVAVAAERGRADTAARIPPERLLAQLWRLHGGCEDDFATVTLARSGPGARSQSARQLRSIMRQARSGTEYAAPWHAAITCAEAAVARLLSSL